MNYSEILTNFRKSSGKSQKEFAELLGLPQTTWAGYELGKTEPKMSTLILLAEKGYFVPELTPGSAKEVLDKISNETGLTHDEIYRQRIEQLKDLPPETTVENFPPADYKQELNQNDTPESATSEAKRKANTRAAITMLENAAQSIQAAVMLLKESMGE